MRRQLLMICLSAMFLAAPASNLLGEADPVEEALAAAKVKYEKAIETAQATILDTLTERAAAEQAAGNLNAIEVTHAEITAFKEKGEFPASFSAKAQKAFESKRRVAAAKLEQAYDDAIKQYTKGGNLAVAKAIRQERDEFTKPSEFQKFEGHWFVRFKSVVHTYKIAKNGDVKFGEKTYDRTGKLYRNKGDVLLKFEDGKLERLTIVQGKMIIFHYHPDGLYAAGKPPSDKGEGVLIK